MANTIENQPTQSLPITRKWQGDILELLLLLLIATGIIFRFSWVNWSQGASLHPDEYGLTNTLTALSLPKTLGDYFNTRVSPLSPYQKYDLAGQKTADGPDNRMRWGQWPITLLRAAGELTGNTGYDEIRLLGRQLSALADVLSIFFLFLAGKRLYNRRVGLLAAALSALAVMQIQQSHFMTVDNFAACFTSLALYAAVRAAQEPPLLRLAGGYQLSKSIWKWYGLFGVAFGMTLAARINLLPLAGLILIAALISIADLKLKTSQDLQRIVLGAGLFLVFAAAVAGVTFRITQPMSFRAKQGDTTLLTLTPNPDWVESMQVASAESNGIGGGPPSEQWANRPAIFFPLENMVLWGMGLPLGLAAWAGFGWAAWRSLKKGEWRAHLIPLVWTGGYFFFMGTRWVKSIRYFLPIYPFLCLLAAWALLELWQRRDALAAGGSVRRAWTSRPLGRAILALPIVVVLLGTLAWAYAFVDAVYLHDHTRIQATKWAFQNIPAPFELVIQTADGIRIEPLPAPDGTIISSAIPFTEPFVPSVSGKLIEARAAHAVLLSGASDQGQLHLAISTSPDGSAPMDETDLPVGIARSDARGGPASGALQGAQIQKGMTLYLTVSAVESQVVRVFQTVVSNENWDEGLPVPFEGRNPFGGLYRGITMEVRWYDDEQKRQMFLDNLAQVDYIIMPSQRAVWSVARLPLTYPMTMDYYRALFDGRLGFDLVAQFSAPLRLGPLTISDTGGTAAWGRMPDLPLFNDNSLAAEEAFSVYDHPPVWIFEKRPDFNLAAARQVLEAVDLSQVVVQSPKDATPLSKVQR